MQKEENCNQAEQVPEEVVDEQQEMMEGRWRAATSPSTADKTKSSGNRWRKIQG